MKYLNKKLLTRSLDGSVPLCANVIDYSSTSDPSAPLPTGLSLTVNAPAKAAFSSFGVLGFSSTNNTMGVTSTSPGLPFTLTNPLRNQIILNFENPDGGAILSVLVKRVAPSDEPVSIVNSIGGDAQAVSIAKSSGIYVRSDYDYLLKVFGTAKLGANVVETLALVYSPVKFLPLTFGLVGVSFSDNSEIGQLKVSGYGLFRDSFTSVTSYEVLDPLQAPVVGVPSSTKQIIYGTTSLTFTF